MQIIKSTFISFVFLACFVMSSSLSHAADVGLRGKDGQGNVIVFDGEPAGGALTSPLRLQTPAGTVGVKLVATNHSLATPFRIQNGSTVMALKEFFSFTKLSDLTEPSLNLDNIDNFGYSLASIGDIDGDGVGDLAVGVPNDDDRYSNAGAVYILFLNPKGTIKRYQKISELHGGFSSAGGYDERLSTNDRFGESVGFLGDFDGDGVGDIVVGSPGTGSYGATHYRIYILLLNTNGTVKTNRAVLNSPSWKYNPGLGDGGGRWGYSVSNLGDLDGDGVQDIAIGLVVAHWQGNTVWYENVVCILFMNSNMTIKGYQHIKSVVGTGDKDTFGYSMTSLGDLNGDGINDMVVGAHRDNWWWGLHVLFLNSNGTVKGYQTITRNGGNFQGNIDKYADFGFSCTSLGDLDGDGIGDLVASVPNRDTIFILFLNANGKVKSHQEISGNSGNFPENVSGTRFGTSVTSLDDLDGDGVADLAVGARLDDDGGYDRGAIHILFLASDGSIR
jgi:hypothetical protein